MNNIALLILRVVFAGSMLYGHGLSKFNKLVNGLISDGNLSFANPIGIGEIPTLILAVFSEFLAPIFIIFGYKTKLFSFFPAATMFVAAFIVHMGDPFGKVEKALLFLAVFVILMLTGPGKYSMDKVNSKTEALVIYLSSCLFFPLLYFIGVGPIIIVFFLVLMSTWYLTFLKR